MSGKTILVMSRGVRLNYMFKAMARELAPRHRVVVLAFPDEVELYRDVPGIEIRTLDSWDVAFWWRQPGVVNEAALRERAQVIERQLEMPLYKAAGDYLLHGRVVRSYGGYWPYLNTERDCLLAFVESFDTLSKAFDAVRPDVVFYESVDLISTYVALAMSRRCGVFALQMPLAPIGGGISAAYGVRRTNIVLNYLYAHRELISASSYEGADRILANPKAALYKNPYATFNKQTLAANAPLSRDRLAGAISDPGRLARGARNWRWHARSVVNRAWLDRHLSRVVPAEPYIAFPLSHLPEASTCSQAPRWVDHNAIAEQLALNAPSSVKIVLKEHPRSYGRRGASYFRALMQMPNVVVCHPGVPNHDLLAGAEAILTTTGTSGLEGIVLGKKVGALGRPYYVTYRGVRRLSHPEELFDALADPSWNGEHPCEERRVFLAAYLQSLHDFCKDRASLYPADGGVKWARALEATTAFIDTHSLKPSQFDAGLGLLR